MSEKNWLVNVWVIRIIRLAILAVGWSAIIINLTLSTDYANLFSYYTIQSNYIVLVWLTIAIILQEMNEDHLLFSKIVRGAITVYIFVTFLVFVTLLEDFSHEGIGIFTNFSLHYFVPLAFLVDWILTETKREYKWKFIILWLAYPVFYLLFTLVRGTLTGLYAYPFLDLNTLGPEVFAIMCLSLAGAFVVLGALFVLLNKLLNKQVK